MEYVNDLEIVEDIFLRCAGIDEPYGMKDHFMNMVKMEKSHFNSCGRVIIDE